MVEIRRELGEGGQNFTITFGRRGRNAKEAFVLNDLGLEGILFPLAV